MSRRLGWRCCVLLLSCLFVLTSCGLTQVQVPVSFQVNHTLKFVAPKDTERVSLPVTVAWKDGADGLEPGRRFAVFLDKDPVGPRDVVRLRLCASRESEPPTAGEDRHSCKVDFGKRVWLTRDTRLVLDCIRPIERAPDRVRNRHTVSIIIIDDHSVRVGQAGISRTFEVRDDAALRACSGEVR